MMCNVAIFVKECKGMTINCCSNTDFIELCWWGSWGQWAGSCCCCAGALRSRPTPNGQTSCRSSVCSSAGLQEAGRAWELPPPCPGRRVPALSAFLWKGVIDGTGLTPCFPNNWLMRDRGWTESSGPLHVFLLWFSEANVGSVAVIIQSFFSICLLFEIFSGAYVTLNTFQGCHFNNLVGKLKLFSALFVRLHGFEHGFVKWLKWPSAFR